MTYPPVPDPSAPRPQSAVPYPGAPESAVPYPGAPQSAVPYSGAPYPQPPFAPAPLVPAPFVPGAYQPGFPAGVVAPFGVDPLTGVPLSDKSKVAAGLLQLLPGLVFGLGGIGRLYAGHTAIGAIQLVVTVLSWVSFFCGFLLILPFAVTIGAWLWFVIDGIVLMTGRPVDGDGRLLRS